MYRISLLLSTKRHRKHMKTSYQKKYSRNLGREMEYKTYGEQGRPVMVFASQNGRFFDYEDFGMVDVLSPYIESGKIRLICADSIDQESWSDSSGDPKHRIEMQEKWFHYIVDELLPEVRKHTDETFIATGCSMGGYHAGNFFFRRPDLFDTMVALSGLYNADYFFGQYMDQTVYENSPLNFLAGMPDEHPYWDMYRKNKIILCVGQGAWEEDLLSSTRRMDNLLKEKQVPAWVDYWGYDVAHDWDWWRKQAAYFFEKLLAD